MKQKMMTNRFEPIQQALKKGNVALWFDISTFKKWTKGEIDNAELLYEFFDNNRVVKELREKITEKLLIEWLTTEGWKRNGLCDIQERNDVTESVQKGA